VSASVNLPLHHKVLLAPAHPGKKGRKTVVVWWCFSGNFPANSVSVFPPFVPEENLWGLVEWSFDGLSVFPITQQTVLEQ